MPNTLGNNIKKLRAKRNWSQKDLAEKANTTERTIRSIENNSSTNTTTKTLDRIAKAFGVSRIQLESPEVTILSGSETDAGATVQFRKSREKNSQLEVLKLLKKVLPQAPQNEDEVELLMFARSLDALARKRFYYAVLDGAERRAEAEQVLSREDLNLPTKFRKLLGQ